MSLDLPTFKKVKRRAQEAAESAQRAQGALDQALDQLHSEFGVSSLKEARVMLKSLKRQEESAQGALDEAWAKFKKDHGQLLAD